MVLHDFLKKWFWHPSYKGNGYFLIKSLGYSRKYKFHYTD